MEEKGLREEQPWRVLEFYSGIGDMRYSTIKAGVNAKMVEAFDINDLANDVYEHNFGHRSFQGNIQTLTATDLDRYKANVWLLSPPCQPYTRQGLQKQSADARASSFLQILEIIPQLILPPSMLFVENVVGFETSDTHQKMIQILKENQFETQEFILSPLQFGVPYSRPRYFCLAKRKPLSFCNPKFNGQLLCVPEPLFSRKESTSISENNECLPIERFLEFGNFKGKNGTLDEDSLNHLLRGTKHHLRNLYFTPREVSNLHSFPNEFEFPEHVTLRQRYALLSNNLSVAVVAPLLNYLFSEP